MINTQIDPAIVTSRASEVHTFNIEGREFVLDVNGGIFFEIDTLSTEIIKLFVEARSMQDISKILSSKYEAQEISEAIAELQQLIIDGFIFTQDRLADYQPEDKNLIHALCIILSQDCNLRCHYCYADSGIFGNRKRLLMSRETAENAINFLFQHCGGSETLSITFFGGEPLLNFEVLRHTVEYGKKIAQQQNKKIGFSLTTNGTLLTESVRNYLIGNDIGIMVSLDGTKTVHDRFRRFDDNTGSYDIIHHNLTELMKTKASDYYALRGTVTREHPDFVGVVKHLAGLGCRDISVEPCFTATSKYGFRIEDSVILKENYLKLAKEYIRAAKSGESMPFFLFETMMEQARRVNLRVVACGAGVGYITVCAEGGLYPCHRLVSVDAYRFGDVYSGINRPQIPQQFKDTHVLNRKKCSVCWARYICGGGCRAHAINFNENIEEPFALDCDLMQHTIKLGAYINAELMSGSFPHSFSISPCTLR